MDFSAGLKKLKDLRSFLHSTFNNALHFTKLDNLEYTFGSHLLLGINSMS